MPAAAVPVPVPADDRAAGGVRLTRSHFYWIDWLRFLAAFFVLLDHACQVNWSGPEATVDPSIRTFLRLLVMPTHLGREAVVVFFVLSGALVGGLTLEKVRADTFDARAYAADRIARVYVPLIPALLLSLAVMRVFDLRVLPSMHIACLFGLQGVFVPSPRINSVLWTLAYEMWFYVLAGCAATVAGWRHRPWTAWVPALAGSVLALWILCFRLEWINLACWLVGAFGFGLRHRLTSRGRTWAVAGGLLVAVVSVFGLWTDFAPLAPGGWTAGNSAWRWKLAHLTLAAGTLLFMVGSCLDRPATRLGAWIERRGTVLATFSYTLYLTHFPLLLALLWSNDALPEVATWHSLFRLGWWMAMCVVAALFMYWLFERQTPRVRRWLRTLLNGGTGSRPVPAAGRPALAS